MRAVVVAVAVLLMMCACSFSATCTLTTQQASQTHFQVMAATPPPPPPPMRVVMCSEATRTLAIAKFGARICAAALVPLEMGVPTIVPAGGGDDDDSDGSGLVVTALPAPLSRVCHVLV
jgi:hypothetical protein